MPRPRSKQATTVPLFGHEVGVIAGVDGSGCALVQFPGSAGSVPARSVLDANAHPDRSPQDMIGLPVLLVFESGDRSLPIIVGVIREALLPEPAIASLKLDLGERRDVLVDGRRLVLDAQQEIVLRCGKSTIVLQRDGKVLIRGAHLVSRSSGPNKIKGGSINLN